MTAQNKTPVNKRDMELMTLAPIMDQFPVVFANGATWTEFDGSCGCCGKNVDRKNLRGRVTRLVPQAVTVEAVGACVACRVLTRFDYRIHDDMRITGRNANGWQTWQTKPTFFRRLRRFVKKYIW